MEDTGETPEQRAREAREGEGGRDGRNSTNEGPGEARGGQSAAESQPKAVRISAGPSEVGCDREQERR